jgi:hypothetical protein
MSGLPDIETMKRKSAKADLQWLSRSAPSHLWVTAIGMDQIAKDD